MVGLFSSGSSRPYRSLPDAVDDTPRGPLYPALPHLTRLYIRRSPQLLYQLVGFKKISIWVFIDDPKIAGIEKYFPAQRGDGVSEMLRLDGLRVDT